MGEQLPAPLRERGLPRRAAAIRSTCRSWPVSCSGRQRTRSTRRPRSACRPSVSAALGQEIGGSERARAPPGLGCGRRGRSGRPRARHRRRRARRGAGARGARGAGGTRRPAATAVPRRYAFRHPIVRRAVYEAAGEAWRLGAHARAAAALAARPSALAARAHHIERSARVGDEAGAAVLEQAAHQAAARAPAVAARWLSAALRLLPDPTQENAERRLGMLVAARDAPRRPRGRLEEALATLLETLDQIPPGQAELRVRLVAACASCENALGRHDAAHARLLHALAELPDDGSASGAALQVELAADALYDSDFGAMRHWARACGADGGGARRPRPARGRPGARVLRRVRAAPERSTPRRPASRAQPGLTRSRTNCSPRGSTCRTTSASPSTSASATTTRRVTSGAASRSRVRSVRASSSLPMMVGLAQALERLGRLREALTPRRRPSRPAA